MPRAAKIALLVLTLATTLSSQVTSTIQGRISDPSGAVIANTSVRVTNEATGVSRTVQSAPDGYYRVLDLLAGSYEIRVEQTGFKTFVRRGIELRSQATLNIDIGLEVGASTQTVDVTADVPQVETTESRISEVVSSAEIRSLPMIGRGLTWLAMVTPGVQGKAEDSRGGLCCDSLSSLASPGLSSGGNERKAVFLVDGIALHYGDGFNWNLAFTPNPDAVEEMRVSTNPTSADEGIISGVQVQMVTKGGTNAVHGTGHFTLLDDSFNALPFGARRENVGSWYQRFFGGTVGGPIVKDRLFFFGGVEWLRERRVSTAGQGISSGASRIVVETEAFKNWVVSTRPNSVAAKILTQFPPASYATQDFVDVNNDGIPDLGRAVMDRPTTRSGHQYNGRVDYQSRSARDRIYGSFWRNSPDQQGVNIRPAFDDRTKTGSYLLSFVNTHTFTASSLNDVRFSYWDLKYDYSIVSGAYHVPCVSTDDGLNLGPCTFSLELFDSPVYDIRDTFSWNRGRHSVKVGGSYRHVYMTDPTYLTGDIPAYSFSSIIDFADDKPFTETRAIDAATGKQRDPFVEAMNQQLSFFIQNTWQVRPGLTLNYGLRWDDYFNYPLTGLSRERETWAPVFTASQVTPQGIPTFVNQRVEHSFKSDLNNFGPRISVAWDPTGRGRTALRGGFFVLYDEGLSLNAYRNLYGNPPQSSLVQAGSQYGIPTVYGIAPEGTRDFPINPGLRGPAIDPQYGVFVGTRPNVAGYAQDYRTPMVYDANAALEHQLHNDLSVNLAYHYRRTPNERFLFNANRFSGDLVDGRLDRLNSHYGNITVYTNLSNRTYHGLIVQAKKRLSQGWQLNASYGYNHGVDSDGTTEAFNPEVDRGRAELATNTFKLYSIWQLPILQGRSGALATALGGWEVSTILNFESGGRFTPSSGAAYGSGGDFNADGQRADRPDRPASDVPRSFSKDEWMRGALKASIFPLPSTVRNGTLTRGYFIGPGYARVDAAMSKSFPINERVRFQFQAQASNLFNRVNISGVSGALTSAAFGRATSFYPMRSIQLSIKALF
ncbi:MAG: TonB-dependent receptor [Acidobacteria bacterium]|nr:TonB-dependent receptor [Acidobacteriota bacterium]